MGGKQQERANQEKEGKSKPTDGLNRRESKALAKAKKKEAKGTTVEKECVTLAPKKRPKYKVNRKFKIDDKKEIAELIRTFWCKSRDGVLSQVLIKPRQKVKVIDQNTVHFFEERTEYVYLCDLKGMGD